MRITLLDDSIPFDGYTPANQPLGGGEKAFATIAGAFARRGHDVQVFNHCRYPMVIEGAEWKGWEVPRPSQTDVLIAFRKPALLSGVRSAKTRLLWLTAPGRSLETKAARELLDSHAPTLVFQGVAHRQSWTGKTAAALINPGVRIEYLEDAPSIPAEKPRAIVTTHPLHGLDWALDLWTGRIHKYCPEAELYVYSAVLAKAAEGGEVAEAIRPIFAKAQAAARHNVIVRKPQGDTAMAADYRQARVHLYPGNADDMICSTLMETQACGVPAVGRPLGAVRERLRDGGSGYAVPDDEAFVNVTLRLLTDDQLFWSMNQEGRMAARDRTWDVATADFEALF